ncbi:hypothetical protein VTN02DRAFT_882 [Thermoascus thermophilus]
MVFFLLFKKSNNMKELDDALADLQKLTNIMKKQHTNVLNLKVKSKKIKRVYKSLWCGKP